MAAFGADGARYVVLREVPFDRDAEVSWDSFVRRYNADLANDFGNLVNRTVSMTNRYLDGERPAPGRTESPLACLGRQQLRRVRRAAIEGCLLHDALASSVGVRRRRRTRSSMPRSPGSSPRPPRPATRGPRTRLRGVLGDLLEACRLVGLAVAPYMPGVAPRVLAQLGYAYPYGPDGNGGPPILDELAGAPGQGSRAE